MTDMELPQAAIEAATRAVRDRMLESGSFGDAAEEALRAALPHLLTEVKSIVVTPAYDHLWRELAEAEMAYRGYTPDEIEVANRVPAHTDDCEFEHNTYSWICDDGDGKSFHPVADEYGEIVGMLGRALEVLAERSATEVKSMCETATKVGMALGHKRALVEAEAAILAFDYDRLASVGMAVDVRTVHTALAKIVRDMASQPSRAASKPLAASPASTGTPEDSKPPQEPCTDPDCPIVLMHSHPFGDSV